MNTFEFTAVKNNLVDIAIKLEKEAMVGATDADWNSCLAIRDELIAANDKYVRARHALGYAITNQYRDEVAVALDGAAVAMYEFMQRLENAA